MEEEIDPLHYCPGCKPKKFVVKKEFSIDYNKLETDLRVAIESDQRYWLQNDAKLRAVQQPGSYEDFRQIVLGAHLQPLDKVDKITLGPNSGCNNRVVWNAAADGKPEDPNLLTHGNTNDMRLKSEPIPHTLHEFTTIWKAMENDNQKFDYLVQLLRCETWKGTKDEPLRILFQNELPLNELPEIILVLLATVEKGASSNTNQLNCAIARNVLNILDIISDSKRFDFTKVFFTGQDLLNFEQIISKIENLFLCDNSDEFSQLLTKLSHVKLWYTK